jgi:HlyD family secretion protein
LRPGMTANVTVVYAERRKVLAVANAALRFRPPTALVAAGSADAHRPRAHGPGAAGPDAPETHSVWLMHGTAPQSVAVHTGLTDGTVTEVVDGDLNEGDPVVVESTAPDSASAPSSMGGGAGQLRRLF